MMGEEHLYLYVHLLLAGMLSPHAVYTLTVKVKVPTYLPRGTEAVMHCHYDLDVSRLYSVKWYKDNEEFFRFMPGANPKKAAFDIIGAQVDRIRSDHKQVALKNLKIGATGVYRCEVNGEGPAFSSSQAEAKMDVVYFPKVNPVISGAVRQYQVGDLISLNCTSGKSHPPSKLQWFINNELVTDPDCLDELPMIKKEHGLVVTSLGLRLVVEPHHFRDGSMLLRCVATIFTEVYRSHTNREVLHDHDPDAVPILENREAFLELKGSTTSHSASLLLMLSLLALVMILKQT